MKLFGKILLSFIALLLLGIVALVTLVDLNHFKPRIEAMAKEQGIALNMKGDLGWSFWPSLGIAINDVSVAALDTPTQPIAELQQASLMLALKPLFSGDFQVDHIAVDGATINLQVDKNGTGNWEALQQANQDADKAPATEATDNRLSLEIEKISLTNTALHYRDAQTNQDLAIHDINLSATHVNTQSNPFDLDLTWGMDIKQPNTDDLQLTGQLHSSLAVDEQFNRVTLNDGTLQMIVNDAKDAPIELAYSAELTNLTTDLGYSGTVELKKLVVRKLLAALGTELETANSNALSHFTLRTDLAGNAKKAELNNLKLQLDDTQFTGTMAITDFTTSAIKLTLQGDRINVDDYLAPEQEQPAEATPSAAEDTPIPVEALRDLNADATIKLGTMRINKMSLTDIDLRVKAAQGMINQSLSATAYQGAIQFNSKTDARSNKALVNFDGNVKGFELAPLLSELEMDKKMNLSGAIQAQTQGTAQGTSVNQLFESMDSTATFSGAQVRLSPLNIEEKFCNMVNLIQKNSETVTWDDFTEMRQLEGKIVWQDQAIKLDHFAAGVSQLLLNSTGKINLANDKYEFKLPIKLAEASQAASLKGCSLSSTNYWVDRGLSLLRCKGSFNEINPIKDCGFDKSALGDLTKDFAEYKLREKHGAKIEAAEQKLDDKKQELKQKADDKKQELFNKLQSKLFKTEKSAAASVSASESSVSTNESASSASE